MALKRPEGLSPSYMSLASPDIPESHVFRWMFRGETATDYQTKYTLTLLSSTKTVLATYTQNSSETEVELDALGYAFAPGEEYYWRVVVYGKAGTASPVSADGRFRYDYCAQSSPLIWNHVPQLGDLVVNETYFSELKENILLMLDDYDSTPSLLFEQVQELFTGGIVPSRSDFQILDGVIATLTRQLEGTSYTISTQAIVQDSLGVSDLERIRDHIDKLTRNRPQPVSAISLTVDPPTMYEVYGLISTTDNKLDPTISLRWSVENIPSYNGRFTFDTLSSSKDIRYYRVEFEYGASTAPFTCVLFYPKEQIEEGTWVNFDTNWDGLYTVSTLGLAKQSFQVIAVDQRGNSSVPKTVSKTYGSNFKAPLGLKHYEYQVQRAKLGDTKPDPNGTWYSVHNTTATSAVYRITGGEGRIYARVRAVDISGLVSPWVYEDGTTFDPLDPPATPKLAYTSTTTSIKLDWAATARAQFYEWKYLSTGSVTRVTASEVSRTGLAPAKSYTYYVRAGNTAGFSPWASITATTKSARATSEKIAWGGKSWNNRYAWGSSNGSKYVMQGEWCEIAGSPNRIYSVPVGYCWGKNKGMWMTDSAYWRSTLAGKKIIKVEMWLQRVGSAHGYYNDQIPTFWLHNYSSFPSGQPSFFAKFQPGKEFDLAEKAWVTLPNYYGEYLRDGKARGIGTYRDNWGKLPYIKYYPNAKLRITYE